MSSPHNIKGEKLIVSEEAVESLKGLLGVEIITTIIENPGNAFSKEGRMDLTMQVIKELNDLKVIWVVPEFAKSDKEKFRKDFTDLKKISEAKLCPLFTIWTLPDGNLLIELDLEIYDSVTLKRSPKKSVEARIWAVSMAGGATKESRAQKMKEQIESCLKEFSLAYLKANRS